MTNKTPLFILGAFLVGGACGYFALPVKVITKEVTVTSVAEDKQETIHNNKVYKKVETKKPDGTDVIVTTLEDKTITAEVDLKKTDTTIEKDKTTINRTDKTLVSLGIKVNITSPVPSYGMLVQKSLIGPVVVGGFGFTDGTAGVTAGINF